MDQPDPVATVLSIPEVLEMILDQLNLRSLLSCRLVNKFWNKAASSVMKQRPVWITLDSVSYKFDDLYKCVSKSQDFPFRGLHITWENWNTGNNANVKVQKYLKNFGKLHTHLRLQAMFYKNSGTLPSRLSEMKFLEVRDCVKLFEKRVDPFCMPSLRTLSFKGLERGNQSVLKEIIFAAPSLEKIEHVDFESQDLIAVIWDTKRVKLVSSMTLQPYTTLSIDTCHRLVANPPTLTSFTISGINWRSSPHVAAMKSVLFASQDTLKTLSLKNAYFRLDEMPVFAQLQELNVITRSRNWFTMFPTLSVAHFPKLRRIQLDQSYANLGETLIENFELQETPMETVTLLELDSLLLPNDAKYLAKVFPRVSHICLQYPQPTYGNSDVDAAANIWLLREFQSLRKLDIRKFPFNSSKTAPRESWRQPPRKVYSVTSMDQFLTGIPSKQMCEKLRSLPKMKMDSLFNEISRPNGSLRQLRGLEELTVFVTLVDGIKVDDLSSHHPFITMISVWCALDLLPGLWMKYECRPSHITVLKKALEPVQEYVFVDEWTDPEEH